MEKIKRDRLPAIPYEHGQGLRLPEDTTNDILHQDKQSATAEGPISAAHPETQAEKGAAVAIQKELRWSSERIKQMCRPPPLRTESAPPAAAVGQLLRGPLHAHWYQHCQKLQLLTFQQSCF